MVAHAPLYLLPGMTPDDRIYRRVLPLLPNATIIPWIKPHSNESLASYAARLAAEIPTSDCFIGGVSFGGIVAQEISRIIRPHGCIVVSSIQSPQQLPPLLRIGRKFAGYNCESLLNSAGHLAATVPVRVRTGATARVTKLCGDAGAWHRWATAAVLRWCPTATPVIPITHIHGDADTTFPLRYVHPDVVIKNGGHVLPLTHPGHLAAVMIKSMSDAA